MKYTLENGKAVNIPDKEIEKNMKLLEISKEEAVEMWLCDHDFEDNEELEELDTKASKVKINHGAGTNERKKSDKPRTVKTSDEKKELFSTIFTNLQENFGENAQVLKENKLISLKIGEKTFKIDIIEQRQPKK
jgi:hypothetical protein